MNARQYKKNNSYPVILFSDTIEKVAINVLLCSIACSVDRCHSDGDTVTRTWVIHNEVVLCFIDPTLRDYMRSIGVATNVYTISDVALSVTKGEWCSPQHTQAKLVVPRPSPYKK